METTLRNLKTDYLDIYQFHNIPFCPKPGDGSGLYEAMQKAKEQGKIRHIAITNHRLAVAREAIESGLYDTLQFPFSYLSSEQELELVKKCEAANMGFIAMKALAGGLINNSAAAYAYMLPFEHVLPIWEFRKKQNWMNSYLIRKTSLFWKENWLLPSSGIRTSCKVNSAAAADTVCHVRQGLKSTPAQECPF